MFIFQLLGMLMLAEIKLCQSMTEHQGKQSCLLNPLVIDKGGKKFSLAHVFLCRGLATLQIPDDLIDGGFSFIELSSLDEGIRYHALIGSLRNAIPNS